MVKIIKLGRPPKPFWRNVDKTSDPGGCWTWTAGCDGSKWRYGICFLFGKRMRAHRGAWLLTNGHIPDDVWVLHKCDNPKCVNPSHLFLGTREDNQRDMRDKGRAWWMKQLKPKPFPSFFHSDMRN